METFSQILMELSVGAFAAFSAAAVGVLLARLFSRVWHRGSDRLSRWGFVAAACLAAAFAGAKHGSVTFPYTDVETRYLTDAGSYVTNDAVHVAWTRSPVVPTSADFCGAVRPCGNTNDEDWVIFFESDFAHVTSPTNIPYTGAQTNNFQFFTTWTPGPTVHTNGVAVIVWQRGDAALTNRVVTYRTGIYENGRRLAPNPAITNGPPIVIQATLTAPQTGDTDE